MAGNEKDVRHVQISVIIPVYNEHNTIAEVIRRVQDQPFEKEIIIVDDCSTDGTRAILQDTAWPENIHILYHKKNRGKGAAIRTALDADKQGYHHHPGRRPGVQSQMTSARCLSRFSMEWPMLSMDPDSSAFTVHLCFITTSATSY